MSGTDWGTQFLSAYAPQVAPVIPAGAPSFDQQVAAAMSGAPVPPPAPPPPAQNGQLGQFLVDTLGGKYAASPPGATAPPSPAPLGPPPPPPQEAQPLTPPKAMDESFKIAPSPADQPRFALAPGSGAVTPAHEVDRRGPSLRHAQDVQDDTFAQAAQNVEARTTAAASDEYAMARAQAAAATAREDAAMQSAAERQQELQARQADFDASVKQLSQMSLDPDRFWASRSTPQKIGGLISIALGGFLQGAHGGPNPGLDIINQAIDRDIKAQEFGYQAARDTAQAKQTAYGMALQKYGSEDAARAVARASALDAVEAQLRQAGAQYKGTDAGNRADMMAAQLAEQKAQQIAHGIAYVPATQAPATFIDRTTGLPYSVAELKGMAGEDRGQQRAIDMEALRGTNQLAVEGVKAEAAGAKDIRGEQVQLPSGEVVRARSATQAGELAEAAQTLAETKRLVTLAKSIRSGESFRVPNSPDRARLEQIQKNLITQYAVLHKLGAISGSDMDLAKGGTADLFAIGPGPEAALDSLNQTAAASLTQKVRTIPDASPRAKGEMPTSFTPHGGK